jgi:predicted DNA-binding transcriptional regulator AlpA
MKTPGSPTRRHLISGAEVSKLVPYSNAHRWRLEQRGEFPRRIPIGPNRSAYVAEEVDQWIEQRIRSGRKIASPSRHKSAAISDVGGDC